MVSFAREIAPRFEIGEWLPDRGRVSQSPDLERATNCYRRDGAYRPCRPFTAAAGLGTAGNPVRVLRFTDSSGIVRDYAITSSGNLGEFRGGALTTVLDAATLGLGSSLTPENCDMAAFGDRLVMCSNQSKLRSFDVTGSASRIETHEDSPNGATVLGVFRQFMFMAVGATVYWSDPNNLDKWIFSQEPGLAGSVVNRKGGQIAAILGDANVLLMSRRAIAIMTFGGPAVFSFDYVTDEIGCGTTSAAIIRMEKWWYWISEYGIHRMNDQGTIIGIGRGKVDNWLLGTHLPVPGFESGFDLPRIKDLPERRSDITVGQIRTEGLIWWHLGGRAADNVLIYSTNDDAFSTASYPSIDRLLNFTSESGVNLDDPLGVVWPGLSGAAERQQNLDNTSVDDEINLDDSALAGGGEALLAIGGGRLFELQDGAGALGMSMATKVIPFSAILGEPVDGEPRWVYQIRMNQRACALGVFIVKLGGTGSVTISARDVVNDTRPVTEEDALEHPNGECPCSVCGVYFDLEFTIDGNWAEVSALSVRLKPGGAAGVRCDI